MAGNKTGAAVPSVHPSEDEYPGPRRLYSWVPVATILQLLKLANGTVQGLV